MSDPRKTAALLIGLAALAGFVVFILFLLHYVYTDDKTWARCIYLFGAVQTIALSAVGFFFGKEVNEVRAASAESRADKAEEAARLAGERSVAAIQKFAGAKAFANAKLRSKPGDTDWLELSTFLEH
jgi:hypothetical protein